MRLKELSFSGVKGFETRQRIQISDFNLIYGANSSGKSTILQSLLLLQQSAPRAFGAEKGVLDFRGSMVDLGGFRTFVHRHNPEASIVIGLGLDGGPDASVPTFFSQTLSIELEFGIVPGDDSEAALLRVTLSDGTPIRFERDSQGAFHLADPASAANIVEKFFNIIDRVDSRNRKGFPARSDLDKSWLRRWVRGHECELNGWIPMWTATSLGTGKPGRPIGGSQDSPRNVLVQTFVYWWSAWAERFSEALLDLLREIVYVAPLREFPRRVVTQASDGAGPGVRGERLVLHLARNPELVERVNNAFDSLEIPYHLDVDWLQARRTEDALGDVAVAVLTDSRNGVSVSPADVGFGLSQILPVVVQLVGNIGKTILIEQPEIHLHPKMQSRIADIMLESVRENHNRLVVETHSEHILLRAQRRLRDAHEHFGLKSRLSVYYVNSPDAVGRVTKLRVNDSGRVIDPWPDGFFDERLEDLFAES